MKRRALAVVVATLLAGCGSNSAGGDRDADGVSDGWDAHPDRALAVDRSIESAVRHHAGKPGLVTVQDVGTRVDACRQSPAQAVAIIAANPRQGEC
jgi:hypothetical protein